MPGCLFPTDFLLLQDRLCRPPLRQWANNIHRELQKEFYQEKTDFTRIASLLNLAALVEASRGNTLTARAVCEAELHWLANLLSQESARATILGLALQPWINIGRALRLDEKIGEALEHFTLVFRIQMQEPVMLGPCMITSHECAQLVTSEILESLWNVYLVDSLKSYFKARTFGSALEFVRRLYPRKRPLWDNLLLEGKIISYIGIGDYERAYWLAKSQTQHELLNTLVFMLHQACCSAALNRIDLAHSLASELTSFVTLDGLDSVPVCTAMRLLGSLGNLLETLDRKVDAASVFERGYKTAILAGDQPAEILFLRAQKRYVRDEHSRELDKMWRLALNDCYYDDILQSEGLFSRRQSQPFDDLLKTIMMVTGDAFNLRPELSPDGVEIS